MEGKMTPEEHKQAHIKLHKSLDLLITDFILHTGKTPGKTTVYELMEWSYVEAESPSNIPE